MSTRCWTHTLVGHRVDMSCLLGKQVKLPGTKIRVDLLIKPVMIMMLYVRAERETV